MDGCSSLSSHPLDNLQAPGCGTGHPRASMQAGRQAASPRANLPAFNRPAGWSCSVCGPPPLRLSPPPAGSRQVPADLPVCLPVQQVRPGCLACMFPSCSCMCCHGCTAVLLEAIHGVVSRGDATSASLQPVSWLLVGSAGSRSVGPCLCSRAAWWRCCRSHLPCTSLKATCRCGWRGADRLLDSGLSRLPAGTSPSTRS